MRLDIAAGTAVRFEPGESRTVTLVAYGGDGVVDGFNRLVEGPLDDADIRERALERARRRGFRGSVTWRPCPGRAMPEPTGRPRATASGLATRVSWPWSPGIHLVAGDELTTGAGKSYRDGMGMDPGARHDGGALDLVIHNALVIDPVIGIVKADIGVRDGRIAGIGKAGNPRIMDGVHPALVCGPSTVVAHGERLIATPGGIDVHVHFKSPDLVRHALATGLTTLVGGGHGPLFSIDSGGAWTTGRMLQATDALPMNFGFLGRGSTSRAAGIREHVASGIIGIKVARGLRGEPRLRSTRRSASPTTSTSRCNSTPTR